MADFDFFAEVEQPESPTLGDYGKAAYSGLGQLSSSAQSGLAYAANKLGEKEAEKNIRKRGEAVRAETEATIDSMSPVAKQRLQSSVLTSDFWDHPLSAAALKMTQMAPSTVAAGAAGALGGVAGLGVIGETVLAGGVNAALAGGEFMDEVRSRVASLDDAGLKAANPYYAGLRTRMSEDEARAQLETSLIEGNGRLPINLLVGALGGAAGLPGMIARGSKGAIGGGLRRRMALGAAEGAAPEFVEESVGDVTAQQAAIEGGMQKGYKLDQTLAAGLEGALLGGVPAAGLSALHKTAPIVDDSIVPGVGGEMTRGLFPDKPAQPATGAGASTGPVPKGIGSGNPPKPAGADSAAAPAQPLAGWKKGTESWAETTPSGVGPAGQQAIAAGKGKGRAKPGITEPPDATSALAPDPAQALALNQSTPGPTDTTLLQEPPQPNPQVFAPAPEPAAPVVAETTTPVTAPTPPVAEPAQLTTDRTEQPDGVTTAVEGAVATNQTVEPPQIELDVFDEDAVREQARRELEDESARARAEGRPLPSITDRDISNLVETRRKEWQVEQEKLVAEQRRAQRDLAEAEAEEKENAPPQAPQDFKSKKNPGRDDRRAQNRAKSDELFEEHKGGMDTAGRTAVLARVEKILAAAKERGISVAQKLDYAKHSAGQAFLKEAQILRAKARAKKGVLSAEDISRFQQAEFDLREGLEGYDRYKKNAQAEGDAKHGAKFNEKFQKDAKAKADEARNEVSGELSMRGEGDEFSNDDRENEKQTTSLADAVIDREDERFEVDADGEVRQKPIEPEPKPKVELKGDEHTAGADKAGTFKVEAPKRRAINRPGVGPKTQEAAARNRSHPTARAFSSQEFHARREAERKAKEAIAAKHGGEREGHVSVKYGKGARAVPIQHTERAGDVLRSAQTPRTGIAGAIFPDIRRRLRHLVGDAEIHWVSAEDMAAMHPDNPLGYYKPKVDGEGGYIVLSEDVARLTKEEREQIVMHEMLHAATEEGLLANPAIKARVTKLYDAVKQRFPEHQAEYGFTNESEFVAEAFSNPEFARLLAETPVSKELARELGLQKPNLWQALVDVIRQALDLPGGSHTALDALVHPVNEAMVARARAVGRSDLAEARPFIRREAVTREVTGRATNAGEKLRATLRFFASNTMLSRMAEKYGAGFGDAARRAVELRERMAVAVDNILRKPGGVHELTVEGDRLRRAYPDAMDSAFRIGHLASEHNLDLSDGAKNEHIFGKVAGSDILNATQAKEAYVELKRDFDALKRSHPEVAAWIEKTAKYYRDDDNAKRLAVIRNVLDVAGIDEKSNPGLAERVLDNKLLPSDVPLFNSIPVLQHLNEIAGLKRMKGWYFPFMREGDFIAHGSRPIPNPTGKHLIRLTDANGKPSNEVLVVDPHGKQRYAPSRRAAKDYMKQLYRDGFHAEAETVYVLKSDGKTVISKLEAEAIGAPATFKASKVVIDNEFMTMHKTPAERDRVADEHRAQGYEVFEDRRQNNPNAKFGGLVPSQVQTLINSLQGRDRFKGMPQSQQNELVQALRSAAIKLLPGTRIQHHNLHRKNVAGYQKDMIQSLDRYGQQSASYQARTEFQPQINAALTELQNEIKSSSAKKRDPMREIARDLETRLAISDDFGPRGALDNAVAFVNKLSMLDKLVGPSFHLINAQEPWTTAAPVIGGRHGFGSAVGALKGAYGAIGARGALAAGFRDTRKAYAQDAGFTDYRAEFKDQIAQNISGERGGRLNELLDYLHDLNLFGHEAGMEVQRLAQPSETLIGRVVDRVDLMSRQVGQAIEAVNRAATAIAAYELEFKKNGGNHQAAMRYAHDIVHDTMGNYSASNSAPVFNSTLGKSALQFKKFAVRTYFLLGSTMGKAMKGDREAQRAFAGVMFTHAVVAGALGLPLEPIKVALMASGALGGFSYDDFEALVRDTAAQALGKTGGEALTRGIPRAFLGYDASGRQGLADLLTFGKPLSNKQNDIKSWLFDTVAGAPAGMPLKAYAGVQAALGGDAEKAIDNLIPVKAVRDVARAGFGMMGGKKDRTGRQLLEPYSPFEAGVQALGFTPSRKAETYEESRRVNDQSFERKAERSKLISAWVTATSSGKADAWRAVQAFNRTVPRDAQITAQQLRTEQTSRRKEKAQGKYDRGMRIGKQNRDLYEQAEKTY